MIIKALKTFSDGVIAMHEGEIANVPDAKAQRFIAEGYAVEYTGEGGDIDLSAYAKKTDIPDVSNFISEDNFKDISLSEKPLTTKQGIYDKKTGNCTIVGSGTTVNITGTEGSYCGAFFRVDIDPTQNNYINIDTNIITSETVNVGTGLDMPIFISTSNTSLVLKKIGSRSGKVGLAYNEEIVLTPEYISENNIPNPILIGITNNRAISYDVSISNTYGGTELSTVKEMIDKVETISKPLIGKKAIFLGDSITELQGSRSWVDKFVRITGCTKVVNVAVSGATLKNYASTELDGNPTQTANNTLANQVQKIINNQYETPDLIIIAIGTNDGIGLNTTNLEATYFTTENNVKVSTPLADIDKTTNEGAFRWCNETLHNLYPNSVICWCNPIQGANTKNPKDVSDWADNLKTLTQWGGVNNIETNRCGIMMANQVQGAEGEDLRDGLHPNSNGAMKIARYNATAISRLFL